MQQTALQSTTFAPVNADASGLFGHPRGLSTLFFTEMWERFSYYGMRALLVLYMVAPIAEGGLGFTTQVAASIYGFYTMAVYMSSIPGGMIADRLIGARKAILIGGIIIALGHFTLAVPSVTAFAAGLLLIVFGTGMLKPNISALLGSLYPQGDDRRDAGFSIFYMGINIGAAMSPLVCGYLAQHQQFKDFIAQFGFAPESSWHFGFAAAGVGMLIGLAHFVLQRRLLGNAGEKPTVSKKPDVVSGAETTAEPVRLSKIEWQRFGAIAILFVFNMMFWAVYEQGGSSLNLFADRMTRNEVFGWSFPSSWFQSVPALFVILLAPVFSEIWLRMGEKQPSSPVKFTLGLAFIGIGTALAVPATMLAMTGKVSPLWLVGIYFLQVVGELCLSPVGLSTVTKLAPQRFVGMTMGVWFVSMALGNFMAGWLAGFFDEKNVNGMVTLFGGMGAACIAACALLFLLKPKVEKLMGGIR